MLSSFLVEIIVESVNLIDADVKIENYYHRHDGEELGFNKKKYIAKRFIKKTQSKKIYITRNEGFHVLQKRLQDIFKTTSRRFEDVLKTSSRRL